MFNGETMSFSDLEALYLDEYTNIVSNYIDIQDVPEDVLDYYYSIEDTIHDIKVEYGIDNDTLGQLYIDLVNLYNEYAQAYGYSDYIEISYSYDSDEIKQISDDIKEYIIPVLEKYSDIIDDNPIFYDTANKVYSIDTAKEISSTIISSVGDKYYDIYEYMVDHNLLSLDDDYVYAQGYTTAVQEYSEAFIYLTFNENNFYDWFTNGVSHEFGHFIDWYTNTDYFAAFGMAIAENVSVSFSYICNDNLDSYFDDTTSIALTVSSTIDNTYNYINNVFSMNEFELYAFENADTITPSDLEQKIADVYLDYGLVSNIAYQIGMASEYSTYSSINQIYSAPFYMIDYGMAGLTGLVVLESYAQDNDAGLELFDLLYTNDYYYYGYDYETMMEYGLGIDIYADDYVSNIATSLDDYLSSKLSLLNDLDTIELGDINMDGKINGLDLITLKRYLLGMDLTKA